MGRGAIAAALALLLTAALASLARASHAAPTGVTVTPGASQLTVTWTASSGADGYRVQWKSGSQDWDPTTRQRSVNSGSTVTDTIPSLTPTTVYTVRVGATEGTEDPAWSDTATGSPLFGCEGSTAVGGESPVTGPNNDLIDDCENLLLAKAVLDPGGTELDWATGVSISSWGGVTASFIGGVKRVWSVVESGPSGERDCTNGASGAATRLRTRVPAAFSDLTALETLKLRNHELSGTIPAQLGDLSKLKHLDLRGNCLSGKIPSWLGGLTGLQLLGLDENEFDGEIPGALGQLEDLHTLYLHSNQLSGNIPSWLGRLTDLQQLRLGDNDFDGGIPTNLDKLTDLRLLRLNGNNLSGNIPPELGKLTGLTGLYLQLNQLTGPIPTELGSLTKLNGLSLRDNQLTGPIPSQLGNLSELENLWLHRNRLTGPIPAGTDAQNNPTGLAKLTKLSWLYLNCNDLTGTVPDALGTIDTLQRLGINGNPRLDPTLPSGLSQNQLHEETCQTRTAPTTPPSRPGTSPAPAPNPAPKRPRLAAALTAAPDPVSVGESVTFTLTVTNPGTVPLSGVFWRSPELGWRAARWATVRWPWTPRSKPRSASGRSRTRTGPAPSSSPSSPTAIRRTTCGPASS